MRKLGLAIVLTAIMAAPSVDAFQLQETIHPYLRMKPIPEGVGVNIHFYKGNANDLFMLEESGLGIIRMDISWAGAEKEPGTYDFRHYDQLVADMEARGIRILFIIDYGNPLYDDGLAPHTEEGRAAYARFCSALVAHFADKPILWELWNEPNISFWKPEPNVEDYLAWCKAVVPAIREADPDACIIGPGTSGFPMTFLEDCFKGGYLQLVNGVSVHPYRSPKQGPETARRNYDELAALISRYDTKDGLHRTIPILSGEWGYTTTEISDELQGKYLARQWLSNLAYGIPVSIWYDWHDDGKNPDEREHNFGTVEWDYKPKPSYLAMRALVGELDGYTPAGTLPAEKDTDYIAVFRKDTDYRLAIWTTEESSEIRLPEGINVTRAIDHLGQPSPLPGDNIWRVIDAPVYLTIGDDAPFWLGLMPMRPEPRHPVEAGAPGRIWIQLPVTNSTGKAVTFEPVKTSVPGIQGTWEFGEYSMAATAFQPLSWRGTATRRDTKSIEVPLTLLCSAPDEAPYTYHATVTVPVANPLNATLGWRHDGLAVTIESVNTPAEGQLVVDVEGQEEPPVPLELNANEARTYLIPAPPLREKPRTASARVVDKKGETIIEIPSMTYALVEQVNHPVGTDVSESYRLWDEGDKERKIELAGVVADSPGNSPPFPKSVKIDYAIEPGWCFWQWGPKGSPELPAPRPDKIMLWVHNEQFSDRMLCRVIDSTGQNLQTGSVPKTSDGWELVEFSLEGAMGHWGGANDGVIHPPVRWNSYYLQDPAKVASKGTTYLTGVVIAWKPENASE